MKEAQRLNNVGPNQKALTPSLKTNPQTGRRPSQLAASRQRADDPLWWPWPSNWNHNLLPHLR
jgi:hypothetical protein